MFYTNNISAEVMCIISGYSLVSVVRFKVQKRMPIFPEI